MSGLVRGREATILELCKFILGQILIVLTDTQEDEQYQN